MFAIFAIFVEFVMFAMSAAFTRLLIFVVFLVIFVIFMKSVISGKCAMFFDISRKMQHVFCVTYVVSVKYVTFVVPVANV